ncbi:MAG: hypothetical protein FWC70_03010 [Defluviitaleaceae bacterium]|nr:hypothetical protein [Defluviitaleaceae bacterium]
MEKNSRKKRNLEIERAKRGKTLAVRGVLLAVAAVIVAVACFWIWSWIDGRTIMHLNGERIAESDFRFVLLMEELEGSVPTEESHENAFDSLVQTLAILEQGRARGISPADEDMEGLLEEAAMLREQLQWHPSRLRFISDARIAELWSLGLVYEGLLEYYTGDFELDAEQSAELEERLAEHLEGVSDFLINREVKYVATEYEEELIANLGLADFDALIREISVFYEEGEEIEAVDFWAFMNTHGAWSVWEDLTEYNQGDISHIFEHNGLFFALYFETVYMDYDARDEEAEFFRENYLRTQKAEILNEKIEEWVANVTINRNERAMRNALRRSQNDARALGMPTTVSPSFDFGDFDFGDFEFDLDDLIFE